MTIDKDYFLARLANGEDMDTIGQDIADMMNEAVAEHVALQEAEAKRVAEAEKTQAKRDLIKTMIDVTKDLAVLEGMDPNDFTVDDEDIDEMVEAFTEMCQTLMLMQKIAESQKQVKPVNPVKTSRITATKSDDEVLGDFIKSLLS
jgi:hypothetical protein